MSNWERYWNPLLDKIWQNAHIGIALVGPDGTFYKVNPYLCELLGYAETELTNLTWKDVTIHSAVREDQNAINEVLLGNRDSYSMMKFYRPKIGNPIPCRLVVASVQDSDSTVSYFISQVLPMPVGVSSLSDEDKATLVIAKFLARNRKTVFLVLLVLLAILAGEEFVPILIHLLGGSNGPN